MNSLNPLVALIVIVLAMLGGYYIGRVNRKKNKRK